MTFQMTLLTVYFIIFIGVMWNFLTAVNGRFYYRPLHKYYICNSCGVSDDVNIHLPCTTKCFVVKLFVWFERQFYFYSLHGMIRIHICSRTVATELFSFTATYLHCR